MKNRIYFSMLLCCIATLANAVNADIITYPDLESTQMLFTDVTESSVNEALPLFGTPTVNGNQLVFPNPQFEATAADNALDFIDGRMTTTVTSKNGASIFSVTLTEFGTYENVGANSEIAVNAIGFAIADGQIYQGSFSFVSAGEGAGKWSESFVIEFDNPVSSFSFVADNQLFANAGNISSAYVNKEGVTLTVNSVPEPGSTTLGILALCGITLRRRRSAYVNGQR